MPCVDCLEQQNILIRLTNALNDQELKCQDLEKKLQKANLKNKARLVHYKDQFLETSNLKGSEVIENLLSKLEESAQKVEKLEEANGVLETKIRDLDVKKAENIAQILPEPGIQENVYSQIMYKDAKIMDLSKIIDEKDKQIMDLQEAGKERDEVLKAKTRAIQILQQQLQKFTNKKFCDKATELDSDISSSNVGSSQEDKYSPGGAVAFYKETILKDDECSSFTTELTFNDSITEPVKNIEKLNTRLSGLLEQVETMQKKVVTKVQQDENSTFSLVGEFPMPMVAKKKREKKVKFDLSDKEKDGRIQDLEEKLQRSELFSEDLREENEDLRFTIADLERRLSENDVSIKVKEQELSDLKQTIAKVESELIESKNQLNDHKINSLKSKARDASRLRELESEVENLQISLEKCRKSEQENLENNSKLKHQITDLENKLTFADQESLIIKEQLLEAKFGFDEFKTQSENIIFELETEMEKLQMENLDLKNEISFLNQNLNDFKLENVKLTDEKEILIGDLSQLKEAIEISNEFIHFLENEGQKVDRIGDLQEESKFLRENSSITEYRLKFKAYLTKMNVLQKENEKMEDELLKLTDLLQNSQVYCRNLSNDLSSLKKDLEMEKSQRSTLEKSLKNVKANCDRTTCDSKSYLTKIEELQNLLDEKENELQSFLSAQRSNDSQFCQLRRDFEKQNEEFNNLKLQFQQSLDEKLEIESELSKLWNQDAATKKALSDMEGEYSKLLQEKLTLEKLNEEQGMSLQDLKSKLVDQENLMQKTLYAENHNAENNGTLKHQIDGLEEENLKLKRQVESLENRCQNLNVDFQNLKSEFCQTSKSLIEERERNVDLLDQLQQNNAKFLEMENSTETLLGIISDKETDSSHLHSKLEILECELRNLEDEKLNLTSQNDSKDHLLSHLLESLQDLESKIQNLDQLYKMDKNRRHEMILNLKKSNDDFRSEFLEEMGSLSNFNRLLSESLERLRNLSISEDQACEQRCSYEELQAYYVQLQNAYASLYEQYEKLTSAKIIQDQCTSLVSVDLNAEFSPVPEQQLNEEVRLNPAGPTSDYAKISKTSYIYGASSNDQCSSILENMIQIVQPERMEYLTNLTPAEKMIFVQNHINKLILENKNLQSRLQTSTNEIYGLSQHVEILCKELDSQKELYTNEKHIRQNLQRTCDQLQDTEKLLEEEISGLKNLCKRLDEKKLELESKVNEENSTLHHSGNTNFELEIRQIFNEHCNPNSSSDDLIELCKAVRQELLTLKASCKQLEEQNVALKCEADEENLTSLHDANIEIPQILNETCDSKSCDDDLLEQCKVTRQEISTLQLLCERLKEEKLELECKLNERNSAFHEEENIEVRRILNEISDSSSCGGDLLEQCELVRQEFSTLRLLCKRLEEEKLELEEENSNLHNKEYADFDFEIREILDEICQSNSFDLLEQCKLVRREFSTLQSFCKQLEEEKLELECKLQENVDEEKNSTLQREKYADFELEIRQILTEICHSNCSENLIEHCKAVRKVFDDLNLTISTKDSEILQCRQSLLSLKNQIIIHENDVQIFDSQILQFLNEKLWKIDEISAQCEDVNQKMSKLSSDSSILECQNRSLIVELDQIKEKMSKLEFDLQLKAQNLEGKDAEIATLHQEYSAKIQISNEQCKMLESINLISKNGDESARLLIESKDKDLSILRNRYQSLEIQFDGQKSQLSVFKDRIDELECLIFKKKDQSRNALVQCSLNQDLEAKNRDLISKVKNLEEKCAKNAESLREMASFIDENQILKEYKSENERLSLEIEKLQNENRVLIDGTLKIETEFKLVKSEYQKQLEHNAQDAKAMQEENERLLNLNSISNENINKYVQEIHDLKTQLFECRKICDNLQTTVQNLELEKEKLEKLRKEKAIVDEQCRRLNDKLKNFEKDKKSESNTSKQLKTATKDAKALIESLEKERSINNVRSKELLDLKAQLACSERQLDDFRLKLLDFESSHRTIKALQSKLQEISNEKERLLEDYSTLKAHIEQQKSKVQTPKKVENLENCENFALPGNSQDMEIRSNSEETAFVSCSSSSSDSLVRRRRR